MSTATLLKVDPGRLNMTQECYTLTIPLVPISQNTNEWTSRWRRGSYLEMWVLAAATVAKAAKVPKLAGAELDAVIFFKDARRRDFDNFFSPLWKGTLDGLVHAGVFPDDNSHVVRPNTPYFEKDKKRPHTLIIITPK